MADMACPFIEEPVDVEAQILRRNLRRERVIRPRLDVLSFPDEYLFERFRFSASSIIYLNNILSPHIVHMKHRGHALSSEQILCIALRLFANGSFLYNVGDAEHVSKGCSKCDTCTETATIHVCSVPKSQTQQTSQRRVPQNCS